MYEPHDLTPSADEFAARLRAVRPSSPRIDRDRLMYLAGQRSAVTDRKSSRFWPLATAVSWAVCATCVAFALLRPPVVVTQTKIVERTIEAPLPMEPDAAQPGVASSTLSDAVPQRAAKPEPPFDFAFLDDLQRPLTALASRPALFENVKPAAVASVDAVSPAEVEPKEPQTYGKLRRELLNAEERAPRPALPSHWF